MGNAKSSVLWGSVSANIIFLAAYLAELSCFQLGGYEGVLVFFVASTTVGFLVPMLVGGLSYLGFYFQDIDMPEIGLLVAISISCAVILWLANVIFVGRVFYTGY